jgi:DNA-binding NarL/FixJ family response regulator
MSTTSKVPRRLLLVDDHPIVRLGIRQMIAAESGLAICGETDSPEEALRIAEASNPDIAIVDLSLGQGAGLELIRRLRSSAPNLPILVLSMHDETLFAERALRAGARGYIMKQEAINGLIEAIRQVLSGRVYVSERMSQNLLERIGHEGLSPGGRLGNLTDRELEVFDLIGHGLATTEIADRLNVSVKTIETYRANIKTKLNLRDGVDLIRFAATWTEGLK